MLKERHIAFSAQYTLRVYNKAETHNLFAKEYLLSQNKGKARDTLCISTINEKNNFLCLGYSEFLEREKHTTLATLPFQNKEKQKLFTAYSAIGLLTILKTAQCITACEVCTKLYSV